MKRPRPDAEAPAGQHKPRGPAISGSSKTLSLDASALSPFVGQLIECPDTQVKASAMRFLAASALPQAAEGNVLVVTTPQEAGETVLSREETRSYAQTQARVNELLAAAAPVGSHDSNLGEGEEGEEEDEPSVRVRVPSSSVVNPTFNRMSGVQEWADSIALFINVDSSVYENLFVVDTTIDMSTATALPAAAPVDIAPASAASVSAAPTSARGSALFVTFDMPPRAHRSTPVVRRLLSTLQDTLLLPLPSPAAASAAAPVAAEVPLSAALGGRLAAARAAAAGDLAQTKAEAAEDAAAAAAAKEEDEDASTAASAPDGANSESAPSPLSELSEWGVPPVHAVHLLCRFQGGPYRYWGRLRLLCASNLRAPGAPAAGAVRLTFQAVDAAGLGPLRREVEGMPAAQRPRSLLRYWGQQGQQQRQQQGQQGETGDGPLRTLGLGMGQQQQQQQQQQQGQGQEEGRGRKGNGRKQQGK